MTRPGRPPPPPPLVLLLTLVLLQVSHAFFFWPDTGIPPPSVSPLGGSRHAAKRSLPPPRSLAPYPPCRPNDVSTLAVAGSIDQFSVSSSPFLVLFKGGAAGSGDQGTSLACLRECEFRGLAYDILEDWDAVASIYFVDALATDLSLSGGRRPISRMLDEDANDDDDVDEKEEEEERPSSSLVYVHGLPSAEALRAIVSRAVLVHEAYEIWAVGPSYEACAKQTSLITNDDTRMLPLQHDTASWAAIAWIFGAKCGRKKALKDLPQKLSIFKELLRRLPGPVQLKNPENQFVLLEDGDLEEGEPLHKVFFTRLVAKGSRGLTERLSLRRRSYVTTTSMEPKASLVMCHAASLRAGDKVLDPMAGGGGILLAAAQLGAGMTVGVDVNSSISLDKVHGNFHELGLHPPAKFVFGDIGEAAVQEQVCSFGPYDVLLCDPPYGKRERGAVRADGAVQEAVYTLYNLAANNQVLRVGGRMTFFLPIDPVWREEDVPPLLPSHPCLRLVDISRQPLNTRLDRYLVTLHKTRPSNEQETVQEGAMDNGTTAQTRPWHYR